jgi:hypothetical protein
MIFIFLQSEKVEKYKMANSIDLNEYTFYTPAADSSSLQGDFMGTTENG